MNKVALITGTRKGIGRHLALHLLEEGWRVAGVSRRQANIDHEHYRHYSVDVSEERAVVEMVREVKNELGPVHALLNNAGTASMNHVLLTPVSTYRSVFDTNVLGSFLLLRECAKQMV
ncbi:MAG TPA: SDR family oxidoreductase, partial [Opitutales bacterium]|nr:SDR family oxidoreductase [Opitutales bacterium]